MSTLNKIWALLGSPEVDNKYDELQSLIDSDRSVLQSTYTFGIPIHMALRNPQVTLRVVQLLLNGWPESISQPNQHGILPIHCLCRNNDLDEAVSVDIFDLDEAVSVDILTLLLEEHPESVHREASDGGLPIHMAARAGKSPNFLKLLVNAYPRSVRIVDEINHLPIHKACVGRKSSLDTVKYLLGVYPESINIGGSCGYLPIHCAASSNGPQKADIIKYFLSEDPAFASKVTEHGEYCLHLACSVELLNLNAVHLLFDAYPEAIDKTNITPLEFARDYTADDEDAVITFLETQLVYAKKSQDVSALTTLDQNSWLPLHHALKNNVPLGSIKLLVKGNTSAVRVPDYNNTFPLHIACEFSSVKVVKYLMAILDERTWNDLDRNDDSILHYACRGGNCEVVKYLLDRQSPHVSERNADKKLPIHLFCQFGLPPNSLEHMGTIFRLLLAYPEAL